MALPTWADVVSAVGGVNGRGDAVAFSTMPVDAQNWALGMATALCNAAAWGALLNYGIVYLAAHLAKLALMKGSGTVTQEALGQASRSYATPQGIKGSLGLTSYGAEYRRLARTLPTAIGAAL